MKKDLFNYAVVGAIALLGIITILCIYNANFLEGNTATMIGGALSAVATVILGLIAIVQNKKYNDASSDFVEKQNALLENIKLLNDQQKSNILRNKYYDIFISYCSKLEKYYYIYEKYDCYWVNLNFPIFCTITDNQATTRNYGQYNAMISELTNFLLFLSKDFFFFDGKPELYDSCQLYISKVEEHFGKLWSCMVHKDQQYDDCHTVVSEIERLYQDCKLKIFGYIFNVEFKSMSILQGETSIDEIRKSITEMYQKHSAWIIKK